MMDKNLLRILPFDVKFLLLVEVCNVALFVRFDLCAFTFCMTEVTFKLMINSVSVL